MHNAKKTSKAFTQNFHISSHERGPLSDWTFVVKDLIDISGYITGCGNPDWEKNHPPAIAHAVCVEQLLQAGATCLGKTVSDELAFSLIGENHFYGTPLNPKAPDRVPGGSSSGSASAVACNLADFSLGTDTGGSVRVPASNCGLLGFRPSYGRISVAGVVPFAPSFDTVGILAREGKVLEKVAQTLLGSVLKELSTPREILFFEEAFLHSDPEVQKAMQDSTEKISTSFPTSKVTAQTLFDASISLEDLGAVFCALQWAEIWSTHGAWIEASQPKFGPHIAKNFELAKAFERKKIERNIQKRLEVKEKLNAYLGTTRLLCIPTTTSLAPKKGTVGLDRTQEMYYPRLLGLNALSGLASLPQITLPLSASHSIPIGISLLASFGNDEFLIQSALNLLKNSR